MTKKRVRRTLRLTAAVLGAAVAIAAVVALVIEFRIRISNDWQQYAPLPTTQAPGKGDSVVVFAPHCDDETLGCGGMLSLAAKNGAKVRVVLITNGDGFRIAVARAYGTMRVTPAMCIAYAYRRQKETLKALASLGVPAGSVTFLGYPDRGVAQLWDTYWGADKLFPSKATRLDYSPYSNSFTPHALYCGESLLSDVQHILSAERPTYVYLPHPSDNHPDHYATYCFVTAAVAQLQSEGAAFAKRLRMRTYLVHRGDWPIPRGDHRGEPLAPPHALALGDTKWYSLPLPSGVAETKRRAIRQYRSQTTMERGFLMSFARANELVGDMPERRLAHVADGTMRVDGRPEDWRRIPPAIVDPVGDYLVARVSRGGDVRAIYVCEDDGFLYVRMDCVRRLSKRITYTINLRGLSKAETDDRYTVSIKPPKRCVPAGTQWAYSNNTLELAVPRARLDPGDTLFVQVLTKLGRVTVDNTGWHEIAVTPS